MLVIKLATQSVRADVRHLIVIASTPVRSTSTMIRLLLLLALLTLTSCKVYQIDPSSLTPLEREKLINQSYNSHVRLQAGWLQNPFYWNQHWNGWNWYQPGITIRHYGNNSYKHPIRRSRGSRNTRPVVKPKGRPQVKPNLPTRIPKGRGRGGKQ